MKIIDVEKKTGLERATIRFYENEGLVIPNRHENGYRSYSDADIELLLKIKLLRQLVSALIKSEICNRGVNHFLLY